MTTTPHLSPPASRGLPPRITYELRVAGLLGDLWSGSLGVDVLVRNDGATTASTALTVTVADQAQLHGVLARIRDLGIDLLSLTQVSGLPDGQPEVTPTSASTLAHAVRTARLTLRPATVDDAGPTWTYRRLDQVNEWLAGGDDSVEAYRATFVEPSRLATTVIVELVPTDSTGKTTAHVIGDFMLRREDARSQAEVTDQARGAQAELGWVLDPAYAGVGYATEAAEELLRYCFEDLGVHRVVANCFVDNDTSWRLMERLGMRRETHAVRESLHRSGRWLDTVAYALVDDEWRNRPR
jgi:RimJ/RimL family protein N-acetyltransferase